MKLQPLLIAVTAINIAVLAVTLIQPRPGKAQDAPPIFRGRGLEIVDNQGRVRASISLIPADRTFRMPDGTVGYPETILLRLIDQHGRPNVKIQATEQGGGEGLGGEDDPTYVQLGAQGTATRLKLTNKDGSERLIAP